MPALDTSVLVRLLTRDDEAQALKALADNATLRFESRDVLRHAQALFARSKAGFADCLIAAQAAARGDDPVFTFKRGMRSLPGSTSL